MNRGAERVTTREAATAQQREKFNAFVLEQEAARGRKLTGRERSVLWSRFAPHFRIVQRPQEQADA